MYFSGSRRARIGIVGCLWLPTLADDALRWRVLIHEALHSVSVGMNAQGYGAYLGWEEATVETLQRQLRPEVLTRLGVTIAEATFVSVEASWLYEGCVRALRQIAAEFIAVLETDFFKTSLKAPLRERKANVFAWGKRTASDFEAFKRIYAAASGLLKSLSGIATKGRRITYGSMFTNSSSHRKYRLCVSQCCPPFVRRRSSERCPPCRRHSGFRHCGCRTPGRLRHSGCRLGPDAAGRGSSANPGTAPIGRFQECQRPTPAPTPARRASSSPGSAPSGR